MGWRWLLTQRTVLGDRKTLNEIVELFEKVYGFKPALERQGSLEELKVLMHKTRAENPAGFFAERQVLPVLLAQRADIGRPRDRQ